MAAQVIHHPLFLESHTIAAFFAHNGEMDPSLILKHALQSHKTCYLPIISSHLYHQLVFCKIDENTNYLPNQYGILEPECICASQLIPSWQLDLVLTPLVGVDAQGHRLGMGGGFYDRTFKFKNNQKKPFLMGLAYDLQCVEDIPYDHHDIPLDGLATENKIIIF